MCFEKVVQPEISRASQYAHVCSHVNSIRNRQRARKIPKKSSINNLDICNGGEKIVCNNRNRNATCVRTNIITIKKL